MTILLDLKPFSELESLRYRLSICIPTLNRGNFIGETLESIVSQIEEGVEIVIVDGGSTDQTEQVVASFQKICRCIRYVKQDKTSNLPSNQGFDRDCNHAVELARGEYCWLMTDDDLLMPDAISLVLKQTEKAYAGIFVSTEIRNADLTQILIAKRPNTSYDQVFKATEWNSFASEMAGHLTFVGSAVLRRSLWISRDREKYFGTGFVHIGVIFDKPIDAAIIVLAQPLVSIRFGNAQWSGRAFHIWMFGWPELIWSFSSLSSEAKRVISPMEPWQDFKTLLLQRVLGYYSIDEYKKFICGRMLPRWRSVVAMLISRIPQKLLMPFAYLYAWTNFRANNMLLFNLDMARKLKKN